MIGFITKFLLYFFNNILEAKYRIKVLLNNRKQKNEIEIQNIYIINKNTGELLDINLKNNINKLNEKIKYNHEILLNKYIDLNLEKNGEYLIELDYKKYGKFYIFNYEYDEREVMFPFYNLVDLKYKNMNKILDIEQIDCNDGLNEERLLMLERYGGPLNDFYRLRDLGIILGNIYSVKKGKFLFRDVNLKMEDTFLNEYNIGRDNEGDVFEIKGGLEDIKLTRNEENEKYILGKYKKFNLDGIMFLKGFYQYFYKMVWGEKQE